MEKQELLFQIFPRHIREVLKTLWLEPEGLEEIRLRAGAPLFYFYKNREYAADGIRISRGDVEETLQCAVRYSLYAYEEELRQGFLTVQGGHRIGVAGRVVAENGRVRTITPVSSLNVRFSHEIAGCADGVLDLVAGGAEEIKNTLIISPPRCGKTTLLRDLVRQLSNGSRTRRGRRVGLVDERSEIAACFQGVPQNDVGIRTDVLDACPKAEGLMMLIRSMAPEIVAADEIGSTRDLEALRFAMHCGCRILATVHGESLEDVRRKPVLSAMLRGAMFERCLVLGRDRGPGTLLGVFDGKGERMDLREKGERLCG